MRQLIKAKVALLRRLKADVYLLGFMSPYISRNAQPGQFLHIKVDNRFTHASVPNRYWFGTGRGFAERANPESQEAAAVRPGSFTILRRPFSIHKISKDMIYILFRVRGRGTKILSQYKKSDILDIIGPLGRGFSYNERGAKDDGRILVAGGMGVAPLVFLAERLVEVRGQRSEVRNLVLLGAKSKNEIVGEKEFEKLGYKVYIATEDGTKGFKGTVTALLKNLLTTHHSLLTTQIYACGPKEMFFEISKVLKEYPQINCEVSFEQFMGCGLGVCCGCVIETKDGYRKLCKDGPVFNLKGIW